MGTPKNGRGFANHLGSKPRAEPALAELGQRVELTVMNPLLQN
jgi:hypothetical protein